MRRVATTHRESGWSLLEMLVASAIFTTVLGTVLTVYDVTRKACLDNEARAALQLSTRVALDRLLADLRVAGFVSADHGDPGDSFEPIEGAWDTAIAFSGEIDPDRRPAALVVVAYLLAQSGTGGAGYLDLGLGAEDPESGTSTTVRIPGVAVVQDSPPYTLYRVTLPAGAGASPYAVESAGRPVFEPVADDIKSLRFRYLAYDQSSLGPETFAHPEDDIGGADGARTRRARIRRVAVEVIGMRPGCASGCGEFVLESSVSPENLGAWRMRGSPRASAGPALR
jgi:hypothetical protein